MPTVNDNIGVGVTGNDIPSGMDTGRGIARNQGFPVIEPRAVDAPGVSSFGAPRVDAPQVVNLYNTDMPPVMPPEAAERKSTPDMVRVGQDVRRLVNASYLDTVKATTPVHDIISEGVPQGRFDIGGSRIDLRDSHYRLSSGKWVPRYDTYMPGVDNDDRLGRAQSTGGKWLRGLGKFAAKTAMYGIGGIIQPFYGVFNGIKKGSWTAVFNNDFTRWLDDMDRELDYSLAHYYTKEERDMGFLRSMGTANFWANDFLSGLSFTAGAMLSSAAFAGAGMMSAGRGLARMAAMGRGMGRAATTTKRAFNSYLRSAKGFNIAGNALDYATFGVTSAGWEASVEAYHMQREAEENYREAYRSAYGREPSYDEILDFKASNSSAANSVFLANLGILTLSNISMFGKIFDKGFGVDDLIKRNVFGLSPRRGSDGLLREVTQNRVQRIGATVFNVGKRPFMEGVFEEGLQGVASKSAGAWMDSHFNPESIRKNMSYMDALKQGFKDAYGTSEGFKEIGIGMIIGGVMGIREGMGGFTDNRQDRNRLNATIKEANKATSRLTDAGIKAIRGSIALNGQISAADNGDSSTSLTRDGKILFEQSYDDAIYDKLRYDDELGLLDDARDNYHFMVDNIPDSKIMEVEKIKPSDVDAYRQRLKDEFDRKYGNYKDASRFADLMTEGYPNRLFNHSVAKMAYDGLDSLDELRSLARQIGRVFGSGRDVERASDIYLRLTKTDENGNTGIDLLEQRRKLIARIAQLEEEIVRDQARVTNAENAEAARSDLDKKRQELVAEQNRLNDIEYRIANIANAEVDMRSLIGPNVEDNAEITSRDIAEADATIRRLEDVVRAADPEGKRTAGILLDEYRKRLVNLKRLNDGLARMRDPRFVRAQERGFTNALLQFFTKVYNEDDSQYDFMNTDNPDAKALYANDQLIDKAVQEGKIDEAEGYMFKAYNHMLARAVRPETGRNLLADPVTDEEKESLMAVDDIESRALDPVIQSIADKTWNGVRLSPNEEVIYNKYKPVVDRIASAPMSPLARLRRAATFIERYPNLGVNDLAKRIREIINITKGMSNKTDGDKADLDKAIEDYRIRRERERKGELTDKDREEMRKDEELIRGFDDRIDLFPYVQQMVDADIVIPVTDGRYFNLSDLENEAFPKEDETGMSSPDAAQNPVVLMGKLQKFGNKPYYVVSGMTIDRFVESFTEKAPGGGRRTIKPIPGTDVRYVATKKRETDKNTGIEVTVWELTPESPVNGISSFVIKEEANHYRWHFPVSSARALEGVSDLVVGGLTTITTSKWVMLRKKGADGTMIPYSTESYFGSGTREEAIDQKALASMRKNDRVYFEVELDDEFNRKLYDEYLSGVDESPSKKDKLMGQFQGRIVIKIRKRGSGELISVVKAADTGLSEDIMEIRNRAAEAYMKAMEGTEAGQRVDKVIDLGLDGEVAQYLPGRANYEIREIQKADGSRSFNVWFRPVRDSEIPHIVDVGYVDVLDLVLRNKTKGVRKYPFISSIKDRNVRVPVVVLRTLGGDLYAYPVRLSDSARPQFDTDGLDAMAEDMLADGSVPGAIERYNEMVVASGLDYATYAVPVDADGATLADRALAFREALNRGIHAINGWMGDTRSMEEILRDDVMINVDASNPFVGPKIRIRLHSADQVGDTSDDTAPTLESQDERNDVGSKAAGRRGSTSAGKEQVDQKCVQGKLNFVD